MARTGQPEEMALVGRPAARSMVCMHTRFVDGLTIRPLRNGDVTTVSALMARLGERSRAQRFGGAKPRLSVRELDALARVDGTHHVLVAYTPGDGEPAGIAWLVRAEGEAEVACAVADEHQGRGIGTLLARELAAEARASGVTHLHATVRGDNDGALSLLARCAGAIDVRFAGGERDVLVAL
jgi:ribosomal protein S18 acetylase RimI-like enzyme